MKKLANKENFSLEDKKDEKIIHNFEESEMKPTGNKKIFLLVIFLALILGVPTGYLLSRKGVSFKEEIKSSSEVEEVKAGLTVGVSDEQSFKDSAEGLLEKGGINGEGSHHLVREGGESQNVYLTSSVIDLEKFVGRKVKVWGQTFAAQKAGWLMDVGKLKVLE